MSKSKAIKRFEDKHKDRKDIDHVVDYLSSVYPYKKRFNFSYEQAVQKTNEWTNKLNNKNKDQTTSGKVETILEFDKGFKLVRLIDQESKNWEGYHMGHCVASYTNHEDIYSIRNKDNVPKCTIEVGNNYINQIKGKANGAVAPLYIDYILKSLKYFNYNINLNDLENIGYLELNNDMKESFTNLKIITINDKKYFYTKNQLKLSKDPKYKQKIFYILCKTGQSLEYIKKCIHSKLVDPSASDNHAIRWASQNGHYNVVELLLQDKRVDPSDRNNVSIRLASKYGNDKIVKLLLKDKRVDPSDAYNSSIRSASLNGHYKVVDLLLEDKKVDPSSGNNYAIRCASENGHYKVVESLLQYKRVNPSANNNESIRWACKNGHYKVVELLLKDKRVDPSACNDRAIRFASNNGYDKIVELLLQNERVDPSANNNESIRCAIKNGQHKVVKLLQQYGVRK